MPNSSLWCQPGIKVDYLIWLLFNSSLLMLLFNVIFAVYMVKKEIKTKKKEKTDQTVHKLGIVNLLLFIFSGISFSIHTTFCIAKIHQLTFIRFLYTAGFFTYMLGLPLFSFLYLLRIKHRLNKTNLAISKSLFVCLSVLYVVQLFCTLSMTFCFTFNKPIGTSISYIIYTISYLTSSCLLLYIFIKKIYLLGKQMCEISVMEMIPVSITESIKSSKNDNSGELTVELTKSITSTTQEKSMIRKTLTNKSSRIHRSEVSRKTKKTNKLLRKTMRNILCVFVALMTSNILQILSIYRICVDDTQILWILHVMLLICDESINILCLYFQHKYSDSFYWKCCAKPHRCIHRLFVRAMPIGDVPLYSREDATIQEAIQYSTTGNETTGTGSSTAVGIPTLQRDRVSDIDLETSGTF
eukprot:23800_1